MITSEQIKFIIESYTVKDGKVYLISTGEEIKDEHTILAVKTARFIYNEARSAYKEDEKQFGKPNGGLGHYVEKAFDRLSINGQTNDYTQNKLINAILSSQGHLEQNVMSNTLIDTKYDMLLSPKKEYTLAFLKLKFREKGLDIDDINVNFSYDPKTGIGKVTIDFTPKKYTNQEKFNLDIKETAAKTLQANPNEEMKPTISETPNDSVQKDTPQNDDISYYYNEMMGAVKRLRDESLSSEEKKQIAGEVYYHMGFLTESLKSEADIQRVLFSLPKDLISNDFEHSIFNIILSDLEEKLPKENTVTQSSIAPSLKKLRAYFEKLSHNLDMMFNVSGFDETQVEHIINELRYINKQASELAKKAVTSSEQQQIAALQTAVVKKEQNITALMRKGEDILRSF